MKLKRAKVKAYRPGHNTLNRITFTLEIVLKLKIPAVPLFSNRFTIKLECA